MKGTLQNLIKQKAAWNNLPTKAVRLPEKFEVQALEYVRGLDEGKTINFPFPQQQNLDTEAIITVVSQWGIEKILKLQAELPQIIERKKEEVRDSRFEEAVLFLSDSCDGARERDGVGFNRYDASFGNWLAHAIQTSRKLSAAVAKKGLEMLQKYSKQLNQAGLELPTWEAIDNQYLEESAFGVFVADEEGKSYPPLKRVQLKSGEVAVHAPYDASGKFQREAKNIKGYRFENEDKSWRYPLLQIEEVCQSFPEPEYVYSADIEGLILEVRSHRLEAEAAKETKALESASEIMRLIKAAEFDSPLSNGWHLRDYQKQGVEWLLAHRKGSIYNGGILADDMGVGKTLTALVAARGTQRTLDCAVFVVCPVSLMEGWRRAAEIVEVGVELFSNSYQKIPAPLDNQKYLLICDEAHSFQDRKSKRTEKMLALAHHENCQAAWMLTGTPIKNGRPINLMPLLLAVKHPLIADEWAYMKRYCNAHEKYIKGRSVWDFTGAAFLNELAQKTEDVILRRKKSEVLTELPAKTRLFRTVELEAKEEKAYRDEISDLILDYRERAKRGEVDEDAEALVKLNILRSIGSKYKVAATVECATELLEQGQQVVIFTEFLDSAKAIHSELMNLGINEPGHCELLTGETKVEDRQNIVDRFQSGESKVFIGTIKAGGVGLTLTAASNVILVDRAWTPGDVEQAEDRCHRMGQQNAVFATWLQLGVIDQAIDNLILQKSERIELVLKGKRKTLRGIDSTKDLAKELLAIL